MEHKIIFELCMPQDSPLPINFGVVKTEFWGKLIDKTLILQ